MAARRASDDRVLQIPVTTQNTVIVGKVGSGKTTFTKKLAKQRLESDDSVYGVFFEIKPRDFSGEFMRPEDKMIAYSAVTCPSGSLFKWNMIKEIRQSDDPAAELELLASIMFEELKSDSRNQVWVNAAKNTFKGFINTILHCYRNNPSNSKVVKGMRSMSIKAFMRHLAEYEGNHSLLRDYFEYRPGNDEGYVLKKKGSDVMFFLQDVLERFGGSFLSEDGDDTIGDWLSGRYGNRLFIAYDYKKKDSLVQFVRYFLKKLVMERLSQEVDRSKSVLMVLDEIAEAEHDFGLMQAATLGRENGLQILLSTQSIEKLYSVMSEKNTEHMVGAALAGFPTIAAFMPGDPQTIEVLQKLFGNKVRQTMTMSFSRYASPTVKTESEPIVRYEDFASLDKGECYIKIASSEPERVKIIL